jgi:hypothetical protein
MAGNDSGINNSFRLPELPALGPAGAAPIFDASALQSARPYSAGDLATTSFRPDNSLPVLSLASADVSTAPGRAIDSPTITQTAATDSSLPVIPVDSILALKTADATPPATESYLQPGQQPDVTVRYSDQKPDPTSDQTAAQTAPTVVIDKNGTLLNSAGQPFDTSALDFSKGVPSNIVVQLQHDQTDPDGATDAQKQALNGFLTNQLNPALRQQNDAAIEQGIKVDDKTGQVQQAVTDSLAAVQPPEQPQPEMAPQTSQAVNNINNDMPADNQQHSMPAQQANNYFSKADVPQGQDANVTAEKDMIAALEGNKDNPYETVQQRGDNSYAVGRYGNTWNQFNNYMMMALTPEMLALLGNPPDYSKLGKLLKEHPEFLKKIQANLHDLEKAGKVPHSFADRFKNPESAAHFGDFVDKLHGTKGPLTAAEIKQNLPKDLQESMTTDLIKHGIANGATPGKIALANQLGKNPEDLTAKDVYDPKNVEFMNAATRYYGLAEAKQHAKPDDKIDYQISNDPNISKIRMEIANAAGSHVLGGANYHGGKCAWAAQLDLAKADPRLQKFVGSGNAWDMGQHMLRTGDWAQIDPKQAGPGDAIFFHDPNYLGDVQLIKSRSGDSYQSYNDKAYTGNVDTLGNVSHRRNASSNYDRSIVLRYVGDQKSPPPQSDA